MESTIILINIQKFIFPPAKESSFSLKLVMSFIQKLPSFLRKKFFIWSYVREMTKPHGEGKSRYLVCR